MTIRIRVKDGALLVRAGGHLTESTAAELLREIQKELTPKSRDVVLELSRVESMSAGALPYVFRIQREAHATDNRMVLAGTPERVQRLFRITKVLGALELVENEAEALSTVPAPR